MYSNVNEKQLSSITVHKFYDTFLSLKIALLKTQSFEIFNTIRLKKTAYFNDWILNRITKNKLTFTKLASAKSKDVIVTLDYPIRR